MNADAIFDDIAAGLTTRGATTGTMFGKRPLKAHGQAFACLKGDLLASGWATALRPTPRPSP